jgi:hypothetical protein
VETWARTALDQLHDGGGEALTTWLTPQFTSRRGRPRAALKQLSRYVADKIDRMNYPAARQHGWQIGTGMIESTCKQLVGQRLKGPGMHWTEAGALAITALRATDLNGHWNSFWKSLTLAN